jgi:hypothetical protein
VFATDKLAQKLAIFLIDELDPENDSEKSLVWETEMPSEVTKLFFKDSQLLAVHKLGFETFKITQISSDNFQVDP